MAFLDPKLKEQIKLAQTEMLGQGKLYPEKKLAEFYQTFRSRFGPEQLSQLDNQTLLEAMHDHSNRDGLAYWLEFKNDEQFPAIFGSIAGGSALKFIVFRRAETGEWATGSEDNASVPITISEEEAIQIARSHRNQLVAGAELLKNFPQNATPEDYQKLQADMDKVAPTVSRLAWGHKYFSLLYPNILDDYHSPDYQRFHLIKILQKPPEGDGRYVCAWWFVQAANELEMPLNHLTSIFNAIHGRPHQYWRVGTTEGDTGASHWDSMRAGNFVAIGWPNLGNLSRFESGMDVEQHFKDIMKDAYSNSSTLTAKAREVRRFTNVGDYPSFLATGDIVLAMTGKTVLGIGKVVGGYEYAEGENFPHRRSVEWRSFEEWPLSEPEGYLTTCHRLRKIDNLIEIERHILHDPQSSLADVIPTAIPSSSPKPLRPLSDTAKQIRDVLERKKQVILYGPPGTGKTFWAQRTARELASRRKFQMSFEDLNEADKAKIVGTKAKYLRFVSFHPAYGYEDFLEGYRPELIDGEMAFSQRDGLFKRFCLEASVEPEAYFYLLIDEINRGDIPRIFGELITLLEKDKRGQSVTLPLSGDTFLVPANVFIIGTMNTADRSIALLDTALRRRFGFVEFMPDTNLLAKSVIESIPLGRWLEELNKRIVEYVGRDARNLQIGHAYFMDGDEAISDFSRFSRIIQEDIIPLLEEYCYEDYSTLEQILGKGLVDSQNQRIRYELFQSAKQDDLINALISTAPELISSTPALAASDNDKELDEENDEE